MKRKEELGEIMDVIASDQSPVGMDAKYVHALILDKLQGMEQKLATIETRIANLEDKMA